MTLAHVAGLPLEELLSLAPASGALWLPLHARLHRRGDVGTGASRRQKRLGRSD